MSTELLPNSAEQAVNQITISENTKSTRKSIVDMLNTRIELPKIQIPKKIQAMAFATLAASIGTVGSITVNPGEAFAQTQGDAQKVESKKELVDINQMSDKAQQALLERRRVDKILNAKIRVQTNNGEFTVIPANLIPDDIRTIESEEKAKKTTDSIQPSKPTEQPSQSAQAPQNPSNKSNGVLDFLGFVGTSAALLGGTVRVGKGALNKLSEKKALHPETDIGTEPLEMERYKTLYTIKQKNFPKGARPPKEKWLEAVKNSPIVNGNWIVNPLRKAEKVITGNEFIYADLIQFWENWNETPKIEKFNLPNISGTPTYRELLIAGQFTNTADIVNIETAQDTICRDFDSLSYEFQLNPLTTSGIRDLSVIKDKLIGRFGNDDRVASIGVRMLDNIVMGKI
jgi:hypothetical protein